MRDARLNRSWWDYDQQTVWRASRAALRSSQSDSEWDAAIAPLAQYVVAALRGASLPAAPLPPAAFSMELQATWRDFTATVARDPGDRAFSSRPPAPRVLLEKLGGAVANLCKDDPALWLELFRAHLGWELVASFVDAMPLQSVEASREELFRRADLVSVVSYGGGPERSTARRTRERRDFEACVPSGLWKFRASLGELLMVDEAHVGALRLILRCDPASIVEWLGRLEQPTVQAIAVENIDDLDLLATCQSVATDPFMLTTLAYAELMTIEQLNDSLSPRDGTVPESARALAERDAAEWRVELPARLKAWAERVVVPKSQHVAAGFLHSTYQRSDGYPLIGVRDAARTALVSAWLATSSPKAIVDKVLSDKPTPGALLGALLAVHESEHSPQAIGETFDTLKQAYLHLSIYDYQVERLVDDAHALAWRLGELIAKAGDSRSRWTSLVEPLRNPSEGWCVPTSDDKNPNLEAHVIVVGAMASQWLWSLKDVAATELFCTVWNHGHVWARRNPAHKLVRPTLVHLWARLPLMGDRWDALAMEQVTSLEDVSTFTTCVTHLDKLLGKQSMTMPPDLRTALANQLELLAITWTRQAHISKEARDEMETVRTLLRVSAELLDPSK